MLYRYPATDDPYRVLPHRDVLDCTLYSVAGGALGEYLYEHVPCGQEVTRRDVVEANWCPHCAAVINRAAKRRGEEHRRGITRSVAALLLTLCLGLAWASPADAKPCGRGHIAASRTCHK